MLAAIRPVPAHRCADRCRHCRVPDVILAEQRAYLGLILLDQGCSEVYRGVYFPAWPAALASLATWRPGNLAIWTEWLMQPEKFERAARQMLDPAAFDYFAGGALEERALLANEAAYARINLYHRAFRAAVVPDLSTAILGQRLSMPLLIAPVALALGADVVAIGRLPLWGLVTNGSAGVSAVLETLRAEIGNTMTLCGVADLRGINRDLVVREHDLASRWR